MSHSGRVLVSIRVQGALGKALAAAFDDLEVRRETVLCGSVPDDEAFHAVLKRLRDLNIEIIDVRVADRTLS
jgi:hypothetical protein